MKKPASVSFSLWAAFLLSLLAAGCDRPGPTAWQGYLEGEFVYVASPLGGRLERLAVKKGTHVEKGMELFALEKGSEEAGRAEADERLRQLSAKSEDLRKGQRPSEISVVEARLEQAKALAELSRRQLERSSRLLAQRALAEEDFDRARLTHEANQKQLAELEAQLVTARLGAREDVAKAAEAEALAAKAAQTRAQWSVDQKTQHAPAAALVYDTLYRAGEYVPAGAPVVSLLPPDQLKVRFFVPEAQFGSLKAGDPVRVSITGQSAPIPAHVTYLSPKPEYTPPVLYNRANRAKLVFMVEAMPDDPAAARDLHPGQPADVTR